MNTLLQIQEKPSGVAFSSTPVRAGFLQRKCACGQSKGNGGECEECRKNSLSLQRRMLTSEPRNLNDSMVPPIVHEPLRSPGQPLDLELPAFMEPRFGHDFSRVRVYSDTPVTESVRALKARTDTGTRCAWAMRIHVNGAEDDDPIHRPTIEQFRLSAGFPPSGVDEFGQRVGPSDAEIKYGALGSPSGKPASGVPATPAPTGPAVTPCPTTVRVGAVAQRNHSNLSATEKEQWGTWLGAMSRMDVGPGPDHTGHCMKERLTTVSNNCPAAVYTRSGETIQPCTGNRCLDINRYGSMWGLSDGPTTFLDMHRTRAAHSLLEGTGVSSCTVVCEQTYSCDRTRPASGTFRITRNFQTGSHTKADGTTMHITTGTVTKT
jgi:Domain of unknown function (DUF4157)